MRLVLGNVLDHESVTKTVLGADAVLSCLGQRNLLRNTHVVSVGTRLIMDVMKEHGVAAAGGGVGFWRGREPGGGERWCERLLFATLLWAPYEDKNLMEPEVKASGLEWTILRPTLLTNGPRTGRYTVSVGRPATSAGGAGGRGGGYAAGGGRAAVGWGVAGGDRGVSPGFKVSKVSRFQG